jgi:hypothetical protein
MRRSAGRERGGPSVRGTKSKRGDGALPREVKLGARTPLDLPALAGHRQIGELPSRAEIHEEAYAAELQLIDPRVATL